MTPSYVLDPVFVWLLREYVTAILYPLKYFCLTLFVCSIAKITIVTANVVVVEKRPQKLMAVIHKCMASF